MPRGYRYVKSQPCAKCGGSARGQRKLCDSCWDRIPPALKKHIIDAAMRGNEITIDLADIPTAPKVKRLDPAMVQRMAEDEWA